MISNAMKQIVSILSRTEDLSTKTALEFFAREGDWQTQDYYKFVQTLHAWEIDPSFEKKLRENLPQAKIRIGNSYELALNTEYHKKFDMIVLDNPQNVFSGFCEHFEALPCVKNLFKDEGHLILIFNINIRPFNYSNHPEWIKRRNLYYGLEDTSEISLQFLEGFYRRLLEGQGFETLNSFTVPRDPNYLYYHTFLLKKKV